MEAISKRYFGRYRGLDIPGFSYSCLLSLARKWCILYEPPFVEREFSVFTFLGPDNMPAVSPGTDNDAAFVVAPSDAAESYLSSGQRSFVMVIHDGDTAPEWIARHLSRVLVVRKEMDYSQYNMAATDLVLRLMLWNHDIDNVVRRNESMQSLVDASEDFMDCFIAVLENTNSLYAQPKNHSSIDILTSDLLAFGRLAPEDALRLGKATAGKTPPPIVIERVGADGSDVTHLFFPLRSRGAFLGHVLVSTPSCMVDEGFIYIAKRFAKHAEMLCEALWRYSADGGGPLFNASPLHKLIASDEPSQELLDSCSAIIGDDEKHAIGFCVIDSSALHSADEVARVFSELNAFGLPFFYEGDLCCILRCAIDSSRDAVFDFGATIESRISKPLAIDVGLSCAVGAVAEIREAYLQAKSALKHRSALLFEMDDNKKDGGVYFYKDSCFYDILERAIAAGLNLDYVSSSNDPIDALLERDKKMGWNDAKLLWVYLHNRMNVSATAKAMLMARNTVAAHISSIEELTGLDLSDSLSADRLSMLYRIKFYVKARENDESRA